jgi:hypothetical protein
MTGKPVTAELPRGCNTCPAPLPDTAELADQAGWRFLIVHTAFTVTTYDLGTEEPHTTEAGGSTLLCGRCSDLMAAGDVASLARIAAEHRAIPEARAGTWRSELTISLLAWRNNSELLTATEWLARR